MDYFAENWGSFVGLLGLLASVGGLVYALLARRAARSAEQAAREARQALTHTIGSIDVERAVALITRLIEVQRQGNWNYALALYRDLRRTLSEIETSIPPDLADHRDSVREAIPQITAMINMANRFRDESSDIRPRDISNQNEILNGIQSGLEMLQSAMLHLDVQ